jgi:DNA-binding NtrC family response regulator
MNEEGRPRPELTPETFIARSVAMGDVFNLVKKVAPTDWAVLIQGEPGVGKQSLAREIHRQSRRAAGPFVHVRCGALREPQLDGELFGQEGPGTGGDSRRRPGLVESARGGTLFLDKVFRLPIWASVKLLDVVQERQFLPRGNLESDPRGVRLIASAIGDVEAAIAANQLYCGLYYYLSAVHLRVPPLRARREAIPALAAHFLAVAERTSGRRSGTAPYRFSSEAMERLVRHDWPGNVRELASVVVRAVLLADAEEIGQECVAASLGSVPQQVSYADSDTVSVPLVGGLKQIVQSVIREVIRRCQGNKAAAARLLRLHRRTLYRLLQESPGGKDEELGERMKDE